MTRQEMLDTELVARLARTPAELLDACRVRYEGFAFVAGSKGLASADHESRLDVDVFDAYAHHIVLVARSAENTERVVGSMRVVLDEVSPQLTLLEAALAAHPRLLRRLQEPRPAVLPMLSYLVQAPQVQPEYDRRVAAGERVVEAARRTVLPEGRRLAALKRVSAGDFMLEAALVYGFEVMGWECSQFTSADVLLPNHAAIGARLIPGGDIRHQPQLGMSLAALELTPADLPEPLRRRMAAHAEYYSRRGEFVMSSRVYVEAEQAA